MYIWFIRNGVKQIVFAFKLCWFLGKTGAGSSEGDGIYLTFVIAGGIRQTIHIISPTGMDGEKTITRTTPASASARS